MLVTGWLMMEAMERMDAKVVGEEGGGVKGENAAV